jgi:hypothetical protein
MGKGLGLGLTAVGIGLVVLGSQIGGGDQMAVVVVAGGFISSMAGVIVLFTDAGSGSLESGTGRTSETDTPARVRLLGVFVTLASLALPYIRLPLVLGEEREMYSFVEIIMGLNEGSLTLQMLSGGNELDGGLTLLIFVSVVIAGAFASILHHLGGFVVLFGTAGYGYVITEVTSAEPIDVVVSEFQIGLYVALVGALIIVASSFMSYEAAEKSASTYGSGR